MEKKSKASERNLDELSEDLLEKVLSRLPPSSFLRLRSVCKKWSSVATSPTFQIACAQIPFRDPWFLMVDRDLNQSVIFDTSESNWKNLRRSPDETNQIAAPIAVASCNGILCFRDAAGGSFTVRNPITGACRGLPLPESPRPLLAVAMTSSKIPSFSSYKIVLISGDLKNLSFRIFSSDKNSWEKEVFLAGNPGESSPDSELAGGGDAVYFLSKSGEVVSTDMLRSPSKEFSSVIVTENGDQIVYFLSQLGTIIACNLHKKAFFELPRLLPMLSEYSIDIAVCGGEMMAVVLSEFLETASVRVWRFCGARRRWRQAAAMPPAMSHELYGKKVDINCEGCGDVVFVCLSSGEFSGCVMCHVERNEWVELPECVVGGRRKEFVAAFSFEPRLEAAV